MKRIVLIILTCALLASCSGYKSRKAARDAYSEAAEQLIELESRMASLNLESSVSDIRRALRKARELSYDYNPVDLDSVTVLRCAQLKRRVDEFRSEALSDIEWIAKEKKISIVSDDDLLVDGTAYYAAALERGDMLHYSVKAKSPVSLRIYNADSKSIERTVSGKTAIEGVMPVEHSAVYYLEMNPGSAKYVDIHISYSLADASRLESLKTVSLERVGCKKGDFLAAGVAGIKTIPLLDGVRSFTLASQLKSFFSGGDRAVVPIVVPTGAKEILYSMRISTSQTKKSSDGKFDENINYSYHKVRFLGLPLWSSSHGSSLIDMLLDDNRPLREEDCYCSMYVIRSQSAAKQFQDGSASVTSINYDVDYSTVGTQSCNGRIPVNGSSRIYLSFLNERMRFTNYLWVEASAVVPITEYYTYSYSLSDYYD